MQVRYELTNACISPGRFKPSGQGGPIIFKFSAL